MLFELLFLISVFLSNFPVYETKSLNSSRTVNIIKHTDELMTKIKLIYCSLYRLTHNTHRHTSSFHSSNVWNVVSTELDIFGQ